jgi:small subunit ribosomal protein S20
MAKEAEEVKKVKRPSPQKRDIQHEKRRLQNKAYKSSIRTSIRSFEDTLAKGDPKETKVKLNEVNSILDKAVKKGVIKLNKASRTKSRLTARSAKV